MPSAKREQVRMERHLVKALTYACESAKPDLPGFCWLTHVVNFQNFPDSLSIVWVFETSADIAAVLKLGRDKRIHELTSQALAEANIAVASIASHVTLDSEEECLRVNGGDWVKRLNARAVRH